MKKLILALFIFCLIGPIHLVVAAPVGDDILTVLSRGHVQDLGDFPQDGSWIKSPDYVGTVGQSKRIEGFELKPGIGLPSDIQLCYNVHVQNKGWLYEEADPTTWVKNGDYAGTRGESLRIEAIKIVLLDASGNKASGYHIRYRGHIQNIGDLPVDASLWFYDGEQLGTVGSSLRLEALKLEIVKDASPTVDLSAYTGLLNRIDSLNEADYTKAPWSRLQTEMKHNVVTALNTQDEIDAAVKTIKMAISRLENKTQSMVYDKAGTYGPASGTETINQDVIITSRDVTLQNLKIEGALIIDDDVGDGNVTLNNIRVTGELRVRGAGLDSIHINGGDYPKIMVEQSLDGGVRIVGTNLEGTQIVIGENAVGEILILDGDFDSVTVEVPDAVVKTQGQTHIKHIDVMASAQNATIDLGSRTTVTDMALAAPSKVTGTGTVVKAEVTGNNVVFEKAPESYTVGTGVVVPPVFPSAPPPGGGGVPGKISLSVGTAPTVTQTKIYNGTTGTDVTDVTLDATAITGIAAGDKVSVSATATYADKNAGSGKTITTTYRLSGENAGKYNAPADTIVKDGAITPLQLTLSGAAPTVAITKIYDGTTATDITAQEVTVSNAINGDTVAATVTATYADKKVGSAKPVTLTYSLSGKDADNYQAPADDTTQKSEISPLQLTLSGVAPSVATTKEYDGTTTTTITAQEVTVSNAINGDAVAATATATYADKKIGENKDITLTYSLNGKDADNYQAPVGDTTQKSEITPLQLTLSGAAPTVESTKTYDGTTATDITDKDVTVSKVINGDAVAAKATATYADKNVGLEKKVVTMSYSLSGTDAKNYLAPADDTTQKSAIIPLQLTLSGAASTVATTKTYDGTTATDIMSKDVTVSNVINGDVVAAKATATYDNKNVGENKDITLTYSLTGNDAGNYLAPADDMTQESAITPLQLMLSGAAPTVESTKTYDGTTATDITAKDVTVNKVSTDDLVAKATAIYADKNVGENKDITMSYSLSGTDAKNYLAPTSDTTQKSAITPLLLTLSGAAPTVPTTKIYDGTTATDITAKDVTVSKVINGENVAAKATATYADKKVGENKDITLTYSLSGKDADNYLAPDKTTTNSGVITRLQLMLSGDAPTVESTKTYDGKTAATITDQTVTVNKVSSDDLVATATATYADKKVGENKDITLTYSLSGEDADNYLAPAGDTTQKSAIIPLQLTLSGDAPTVTTTKEYDGTTATDITDQTVTVNKVSSDDLVATATATYADKKVGENKDITLTYSLSGKDADNYLAPAVDMTQKSAITPLQLTLSGAAPSVAATKIYNGTTATDITAKDVTVNNAINGEDVTAKATATYADKNVGENKDITLTYSLTGNDAGNYLAPADGTTRKSTITPKPLTIDNSKTTVENKTYDGTKTATVTVWPTVDVNDIIGGDQISYQGAATFADANAGVNKPVTITGSLTGDDAKNYQLLASVNATATITPVEIKVATMLQGLKANEKEKVYDGKSTATKLQVWWNNTDAPEIVRAAIARYQISVNVSADYTDDQGAPKSAVGENYAIACHFTLSGIDSGNFILEGVSGNTTGGKITKKPLTVSAPTVTTTKPYDGNTTAAVTAVGELIGVIEGENVTVSAVANYDVATVGINSNITVVYTLAGANAENYVKPVNHILQYKGVITGITSATVAPKTATVAQGQTQQLTATVEAVGEIAKTVDWTSGDTEGKVTVSETGLVTVAEDALEGNYTITATSTADQAKSGTATITVTKNNVMTTTYGGGSWAAWQHGNDTVPISAMTPPVDVNNFKLFYVDMNTNTSYGKGDDGKIYQSNDLKTWTDYIGANVSAGDVFTNSAYQLIGIDSSDRLLALDADGKTLYYYNASTWEDITGLMSPMTVRINPTYYNNNNGTGSVIYQKENGEVWLDATEGMGLATQLAATTPALPDGFVQCMFVYDGISLSMLAY